MTKEDHDLLIEIRNDVKHLVERVAAVDAKKLQCDQEYVKKNEIKNMQTAYYLVSRTVVLALASGILYVICLHAKLF